MKSFRFLLSMSIFISLPLYAAQGHHHWGYSGQGNPENWGELSQEFITCKIGKNQSPVNISKSIPVQRQDLKISYPALSLKLENNGHTLQASNIDQSPSIRIDDKTFMLKQFHFHTPSEHTFKEQHFPMEAHFVHQSSQGELAVLAVIFKAGKDNPALAPIVRQSLKSGESVTLQQPSDIQGLLPKKSTHLRLNGSLTTPPCTEGVTWVILETPVEAGPAQIQAIEAMVGHNNRPIQPINSRLIIQEK
ncbi:carbonic anhydrase family protein [Bisgaard Taxon 10/6]|uniref:carbonic anhydrase n=1 Tax=Exercitatus varius TaxID=67857 RepID=UPI00294B0E5E|nr:carbonic anhydrase family protein [Exercitatus varius]MDG2955523.1 carbonic anhydrase family protein [Exercitatus varius]MDG2963803.1 carbonic anhydrase family protein [Exercitatus varius]